MLGFGDGDVVGQVRCGIKTKSGSILPEGVRKNSVIGKTCDLRIQPYKTISKQEHGFWLQHIPPQQGLKIVSTYSNGAHG